MTDRNEAVPEAERDALEAAILCVLALALIAAFAVLVAASLVRDHHAAVEADSREPVGGFRPTSTPRDP